MSGFVIFLFKYLFVVPHYATILKPKLNEKTFNFIENLCMHLKIQKINFYWGKLLLQT